MSALRPGGRGVFTRTQPPSFSPHGTWYRCRHDPAQCSVAFFDPAQSVVQARDLGSLLVLDS